MSKVEAQIQRLESDEHIREFEEQAVPYMDAYVRNTALSCKTAQFVIPGEPSTRTQNAQHNTQTQSDIVAEYLTSVQGGHRAR